MSLFKEIPPTASFPLHIQDLFSALFKKKDGSLEGDFKNYLGVPYARVLYSATTAFYIILEALKTLSAKRTVIIPAYVCPLVALAIARAGLEIAVCDINQDNFDFKTDELERLCAGDDVLAVIPVHLAGLPVDLDRIKSIVQGKSIFIIEDCAQALGAEYKDKKVGSLADFSFFSLCRGKGLTIYEGGVLVANKEEYSQLLDRKIKELIKNNFFAESIKILELFGYWIFYRPQLFWFIFRLPQIFWNWRGEKLKALTEDYNVNFTTHNVSAFRKRVGHINFKYLNNAIEAQRLKVGLYLEGLKGYSQVKAIIEPPVTKATYPYLTLIFNSPKIKDEVLAVLNNSGLGISWVYAAAITDYAYLKDIVGNKPCLNARYLSERIITLSTSCFLGNKEINYLLGMFPLKKA